MKAKTYDRIETLVEIQADFDTQMIPKGTLGTIVECYEEPEGYAVDLAIPDETLVGEYQYKNIILMPEQFAIAETPSSKPALLPDEAAWVAEVMP